MTDRPQFEFELSVVCDGYGVIDSLRDNGYIVVEDSFDGLMDVAQQILATRYPEDIFPTLDHDDPERDAGVRLVTAVRAVIEAVAKNQLGSPPPAQEA